MNLDKLVVLYNGKEISKGKIMKLEEVKNQPEIKYNYELNEKYLLIMVDPDAPSKDNPIYKYWLHWMVDISNNNILFKYNEPAPPKDTGYHRYIFLLLKNNNQKLTNLPINRNNFDLDKFIKTNKLKIIAINYIKVKN